MRNLKFILALVLVPAALWAQGSTFSNHWLDQLPITTNATFTPTRQDQWRGGCGAFSILGTFDSATVTFEASFDDVNFFTVNDTGGAPIAPTAAAENVQFCLPFAYIRVTIAGGGGSLSITQMGVASMGDTVALWLGSGGTLIITDLQLPQENTPLTPTLCFNGGGVCDTGIIESVDNTLDFVTAGVRRFHVDLFGMSGEGVNSAAMIYGQNSSPTVPVFRPMRSTGDAGWGGAAEAPAVIVGGASIETWEATQVTHLGGYRDFGLLETSPTNCTPGDEYTDDFPAKCECTATDTWAALGAGTCA